MLSYVSESDRERTHVFSTFFYKRLTSRPKIARHHSPMEEEKSSAAHKRHARVQSWTKNVDIFSKDFILIPINEHSHWFLAVICFPGLDGPQRMSDGAPVQVTTERVRKTPAKPKEKIEPTIVEDLEASDRDEAEGDEEELNDDDDDDEEDDEEEPPLKKTKTGEENEEVGKDVPVPNPLVKPEPATRKIDERIREPIKQPCILIFDSLSGASRSRIVATLRDYLSVEYSKKRNKVKDFSKNVMKGACPKVPQQMNFSDCGLFTLQFAHSFFENPLKDFHLPVKTLQIWFNQEVVACKRQAIADLIRSLMDEYKPNHGITLPAIHFNSAIGKPFAGGSPHNAADSEMTNTNPAPELSEDSICKDAQSSGIQSEEMQPTASKKINITLANKTILSLNEARQNAEKQRFLNSTGNSQVANLSVSSSNEVSVSKYSELILNNSGINVSVEESNTSRSMDTISNSSYARRNSTDNANNNKTIDKEVAQNGQEITSRASDDKIIGRSPGRIEIRDEDTSEVLLIFNTGTPNSDNSQVTEINIDSSPTSVASTSTSYDDHFADSPTYAVSSSESSFLTYSPASKTLNVNSAPSTFVTSSQDTLPKNYGSSSTVSSPHKQHQTVMRTLTQQDVQPQYQHQQPMTTSCKTPLTFQSVTQASNVQQKTQLQQQKQLLQHKQQQLRMLQQTPKTLQGKQVYEEASLFPVQQKQGKRQPNLKQEQQVRFQQQQFQQAPQQQAQNRPQQLPVQPKRSIPQQKQHLQRQQQHAQPEQIVQIQHQQPLQPEQKSIPLQNQQQIQSEQQLMQLQREQKRTLLQQKQQMQNHKQLQPEQKPIQSQQAESGRKLIQPQHQQQQKQPLLEQQLSQPHQMQNQKQLQPEQKSLQLQHKQQLQSGNKLMHVQHQQQLLSEEKQAFLQQNEQVENQKQLQPEQKSNELLQQLSEQKQAFLQQNEQMQDQKQLQPEQKSKELLHQQQLHLEKRLLQSQQQEQSGEKQESQNQKQLQSEQNQKLLYQQQLQPEQKRQLQSQQTQLEQQKQFQQHHQKQLLLLQQQQHRQQEQQHSAHLELMMYSNQKLKRIKHDEQELDKAEPPNSHQIQQQKQLLHQEPQQTQQGEHSQDLQKDDAQYYKKFLQQQQQKGPQSQYKFHQQLKQQNQQLQLQAQQRHHHAQEQMQQQPEQLRHPQLQELQYKHHEQLELHQRQEQLQQHQQHQELQRHQHEEPQQQQHQEQQQQQKHQEEQQQQQQLREQSQKYDLYNTDHLKELEREQPRVLQDKQQQDLQIPQQHKETMAQQHEELRKYSMKRKPQQERNVSVKLQTIDNRQQHILSSEECTQASNTISSLPVQDQSMHSNVLTLDSCMHDPDSSSNSISHRKSIKPLVGMQAVEETIPTKKIEQVQSSNLLQSQRHGDDVNKSSRSLVSSSPVPPSAPSRTTSRGRIVNTPMKYRDSDEVFINTNKREGRGRGSVRTTRQRAAKLGQTRYEEN